MLVQLKGQICVVTAGCQQLSIRCPSRAHISKTKQNKPIVTVSPLILLPYLDPLQTPPPAGAGRPPSPFSGKHGYWSAFYRISDILIRSRDVRSWCRRSIHSVIVDYYNIHAVAERTRDASCMSVVSFNSTTRRAQSILLLALQIYCCVSVFIARQHADARYWYSKFVRPSVRPSVCLYVRYVPAADGTGLTYRHSFFFTIRWKKSRNLYIQSF